MALFDFLNKKKELNSKEVEPTIYPSINDSNDYDKRKNSWTSDVASFVKNYIATNDLETTFFKERDYGFSVAFKPKEKTIETLVIIDNELQEVKIVTDSIILPQDRLVEAIIGIAMLDSVMFYNNRLRVFHRFSSISENFEFDAEKLTELFDLHFTYYTNVSSKFLDCIENNIDFATIGE